MAVSMDFCLLGPLMVRVDGMVVPIPRGKQRALLATLLLRAGRTVTADQLADVLWGPVLPPSAAITLQNYVKRLRQALGTGRDRITTQPGGYLIHVHPGELDICAMEEAVTAARRSAQATAWADVSEHAAAALDLWRGDALCDVNVGEMAWQEIPRLTEMRFQARALRVEAGLHLGGHGELVADAQQLTVDAPLREHLHALLMHALYLCGRRAEALNAYQHARDVIVEELGSEPGPELQALHRQVLDDDPALNPTPPKPAKVIPRELPSPPRHFAGRTRELAALTRLLDQDGPGGHATVVISAVGGTAGVGKTALALRWAHQVADRFPDGQLFVNLRGFDPALPPMSAAEAIRLALDALDVPTERIPAGVDAQARLYRSVLADKKVLIVADNAADADQVRPLLPGSAGCLVIVTSRSTLTGLIAVDGATPLSLEPLASAEARDLLARIIGDARVAYEPEAAGQLIEMCGHLPLALAITAARAAARPGLPLAGVAAELADAAGRLDALEAGGDPLASVRAALTTSYQRLSTDATRMLRLLSAHPGPDISVPGAASLAGVPSRQAARQLAELAGANLVSQDGTGRLSLHDLVRLYAAERAQQGDGGAERDAATDRMLDHYLHTGHAAARLLRPDRDPITLETPSPSTAPEHLAGVKAAMSWFAAEHQVLIATAGHAFTAGQDERAWKIAWTLVDYLSFRGHWHDLQAVWTTALAAADRLGDRALQGRSHHYLARVNAELARYDDADSHYHHALELFGRLGDNTWRANLHLGLAVTLDRQGQPAQAADQARKALDLFTAAGHQVGQAEALNGIGWYLGRLGFYEQTRAYCQQALAISRQAGHQRIEADTLDSLGYAHHHLGQHADAISCYQQALDIARELGYRYQQAEALNHLGDAQHATSNLETACTAWREALTILDDLCHPRAEQVRAKLCRLAAASR